MYMFTYFYECMCMFICFGSCMHSFILVYECIHLHAIEMRTSIATGLYIYIQNE